jgi:NADH-quinone oxidoreductase subunit M
MEQHLVSIILFSPFISGAASFIPNENCCWSGVAAVAGFISTLASFYLLYAYNSTLGGYQFTEQYLWSKDLGISFFIGVDGISIPLVLASRFFCSPASSSHGISKTGRRSSTSS